MTGGRRALAALALLAVACRRPAATQPPPPRIPADGVTQRVAVYLIAPRDHGHRGKAIGCGDSAVPVEIQLPAPAPGFEAALRALLARRTEHDPATGLSNPLYASQLALVGIDRQGSAAVVRMSGYIELGDRCENARLRAQLQETAEQFSDLTSVRFLIDGQPFDALVNESASIVPQPAAVGSGAAPSAPIPGTASSPAPGAAPAGTPPAPPSPDSAPETPPPPPI